MANPVVFNTKDWGAWIRDKLNEMSAVAQSVADNAAAILGVKEDVEQIQSEINITAGNVEGWKEEAEEARDESVEARDEIDEIVSMNLVERVQAIENHRMVDKYGDGPYPVLDVTFLGPNP